MNKEETTDTDHDTEFDKFKSLMVGQEKRGDIHFWAMAGVGLALLGLGLWFWYVEKEPPFFIFLK